jgi:uncharacterized protein (DUF1810 family)
MLAGFRIMAENSLKRFEDAQEKVFETALAEIKSGHKRSHWIWYIFPQLKGLGLSHNSEYYGIAGIEEAEAYLKHPVLGKRLLEITKALWMLHENDPARVMGYPDDLKLKSSMTLFASIPGADPVFKGVLDKFYYSSQDRRTLDLLSID